MINKKLKDTGYISEEGSMNYELEITKKQKAYTDWHYLKMKPYLKGDILETGSGCGTYSEKLIRDFKGEIYLTEIDLNFIKFLKKRFKNKRIKIIKLDLNNKKDFVKIKKKFDSIISSNVLEHIKDDVLALKLLRGILKPGGILTMYVPCHQFLFTEFDRVVGHYRRYSKKELEEKAKKAGFKIKKAFWFNMMGIPTKILAGNVFNVKKTPGGPFKLYNKLVPFFRFIEDKIFCNILGVGRIIILENA